MINKQKSKAGMATFEKHSVGHMSDIGMKGVKKREKNRKEALRIAEEILSIIKEINNKI